MDDVIYRQDAIRVLNAKCKKAFNLTCGEEDCACQEYTALRDLPSAQKKGHWIYKKTVYEADECSCSECGQTVTTHKGERTNFCPWCGADMRGENNET